MTQEEIKKQSVEVFRDEIVDILKVSRRSGQLQLGALIIAMVSMFDEAEREEFKQNLLAVLEV